MKSSTSYFGENLFDPESAQQLGQIGVPSQVSRKHVFSSLDELKLFLRKLKESWRIIYINFLCLYSEQFPGYFPQFHVEKLVNMAENLVHLAAGISHFQLNFYSNLVEAKKGGVSFLKPYRPPLTPPFFAFLLFPSWLTPAVYGHMNIVFSSGENGSMKLCI